MLKKLRILSADSDAQLRSEIANYFAEKEEFELFDFAYDGLQLQEKAARNTYHIIIVNLSLEKMKWLEMLAWLQQLPTKPYVLVTSHLTSDAILMGIQQYNIKYFFLKPFQMSELYAQLVEYYNYGDFPNLQTTEKQESTEDISERIHELVLQAGIDPTSKGYEYIVEAIRQIHERRNLVNAVTKQLYPSVANQYGVTNTKVERAIRHSIEMAWQKNGFKNVYMSFEPNALHQYDKMSNAEFIALLSDRLLLKKASQSHPRYPITPNDYNPTIH